MTSSASSSSLPRGSDEFAIVVAYNEEGRVGSVVRALRASYQEIAVVVVDDGSIDGTRREALASGAIVVSHPFNLGYGAALQTGYLYALSQGASRSVQLDGDGQHDASSAGRVLAPLRENAADVVIGSRFLAPTGSAMSGVRRFGIRVLTELASMLTGQRWHDAMSGYIGMDRRAMEFLTMDVLPHDYADLDVLIALWAAGNRIVEVPMTTRERSGGRSMLSGVGVLYYIYKMGLSILMAAWRARSARAARRESAGAVATSMSTTSARRP